MPFHRDAWWLMGSVVAAIAAAPLIVQGDAQTSAHRAAAVQKIEQLSPADRQELEENFKRFEKLPAADQAKYREIHSKVAQNPAVAEAMGSFSQWWPHVSAREQADLFKQQDVKQRIAVVSTIQEEIDKDRGARLVFGRGWGREWHRMVPSLPRESFYEVMQTLEALASESYVIQKELPEIEKLDAKGPQRYLKLVTTLHDRKHDWSSLVSSPNLENRVVQSISNEAVREQFRKRMDDKGWFGQRGYWSRVQLAVTLGRELYLEGLKQNVGDDVILKKLASLSVEEKNDLYLLSADDSRSQLKSKVARDFFADIAPVQDFFQVSGPRSWEGRGPGRGEGPMGRGDGPGRGGDGRDGRGDGPMGRGDGPMGRGDGPPGRGEGPPPGPRD